MSCRTVKPLPRTYAPALLRVDFQDDLVWQRVRDAALAPHQVEESPLVVIDDADFAGLDVAALTAAAPAAYGEHLIIVFDDETRSHPDNPLLLVDWLAYVNEDADEDADERFAPGSLRITPDQVHSVHANLSLANLDFSSFAARGLGRHLARLP